MEGEYGAPLWCLSERRDSVGLCRLWPYGTPTLSLEAHYACTCLCLAGSKGYPELGDRAQHWPFQWHQHPTHQGLSIKIKGRGSLAALQRGRLRLQNRAHLWEAVPLPPFFLL